MKHDLGRVIAEPRLRQRLHFGRHIGGQHIGWCDHGNLHGLLPFDNLMIARA